MESGVIFVKGQKSKQAKRHTTNPTNDDDISVDNYMTVIQVGRDFAL